MITFLGKILVFGLIPVVLGWIAWEEFFAEEETLTRPRKNPEPEPADPMELAVFSESAEPAPAPLPAPVFAATPEPAPPQEARDPRVGPMEHALASTREMVEAVSARMVTAEQESVRLQQECASLHSMVQEQAAELARQPEPVASDSDSHGPEIQRLTDSLSSQAEQLAEVRDVLDGLESPQCVPEERMRALEERVADAVRDRSLLHDQVSEVESRIESRFTALEEDEGSGDATAALDHVQSLVGRCDALETSSERSQAECDELRALGDLRDQRLDEMLQSTLGLPHGDKLTKIEGLGSASAEVLNSLGIVSYKQLATLSKEDLEEISDRVSGLGKRIEKGRWVQKAKKLAKK